jgi:YD repeat-containing protein
LALIGVAVKRDGDFTRCLIDQSWAFDPISRMTSHVDRSGRTTLLSYDDLGGTTQQQVLVAGGLTLTDSWGYDRLGSSGGKPSDSISC